MDARHDLITHIGCISPACSARHQNDDLRLLGPLSGQGVGGRARTPDRRVPANLRAESLSIVPPTPQFSQ
ncbi:hypothetical protein PoB_005500700 [Plakobranchus ocellatus]|uniref:Uncharacterized protein n=1 Tax=Plakobranchus ocellatus TaxID=259542 RepID=A0AAV4CB66_9GAST|nr:hypothetical protein PoB_005500700 [Plakobranchus ocellatus]